MLYFYYYNYCCFRVYTKINVLEYFSCVNVSINYKLKKICNLDIYNKNSEQIISLYLIFILSFFYPKL